MNRKRKIPNLQIFSSGSIASSLLVNSEEFKAATYNEALSAIHSSISLNKQTATLVELGHTGKFIDINKNEWVSSLSQELKYFEGTNEYEKCAKCVSLIEKINKKI